MIATDFCITFPSIVPEQSNLGRKKLSDARFGHVGTALIDKKTDKRGHFLEISAAEKRGSVPFLRYQANLNEFLQVMRKSGCGSAYLVLQTPDGQAGLARSHQRAIDHQARRVAQCFQLRGCVDQFHPRSLTSPVIHCQRYF
jgi:hypothetical protein